MTDKELIKYFKSDKLPWIEEVGPGIKIWNENKVGVFWERIRKFKMDKKDYDFNGFRFPEFECITANLGSNKAIGFEDFWKPNQQREFVEKVNFSYAHFQGYVNFTKVIFDDVNFSYSIFHGQTLFNSGKINIVNLTGSKFKNEVSFRGVLITKGIFVSTQFKDVYFDKALISEEATFLRCSFQGKGSFIETFFPKGAKFQFLEGSPNIEFIRTAFLGQLELNSISFERLLFDSANFKQISASENPEDWVGKLELFAIPISFARITFNKESTIKQMDLSKLSLFDCDVSEMNFSRCIWNSKRGRLILNNEKDLRNSEEHYRQLKKNFEIKKDWELSGLAYISELEMRKQRLLKEKNYYQWFIYWFYGYFGGYTQNFKRPLVSLLFLIGVFSIIYYFIDHNIIKALQRGIKGALPYITIDTENPFKGFWLIARNIEFLLGGIFLTFFILALRKRFKQ